MLESFLGAKRFRLKRPIRLQRAEVARRPRKKPGKTIRAKTMVNGVAPIVPIRPVMAPMALAA